MRRIDFSLRVLRWQKTEDAQHGANAPEMDQFPWDPPPEGALVGDEMSWTEALGFLGWESELDA